VSLLWPERITGGLFHGQCWITHKGVEHGCAPAVTSDTGATLLNALSALLDARGNALRQRTRVSLVVSDSVAALLPLAWQEQLGTQDEVHSYAKVCFQKRGEDIGADWVMQAVFRHHRETGLAYALPRAWLEELVALLTTRGLVLDRVLPLTAQAYWRAERRAASGNEVLLLREAYRTGALIYGAQGLLAIDAEAGAGQEQVSGRRLLGRIAAFHPQVSNVQDWSEREAASRLTPSFITEMFADASVEAMQRNAWS